MGLARNRPAERGRGRIGRGQAPRSLADSRAQAHLIGHHLQAAPASVGFAPEAPLHRPGHPHRLPRGRGVHQVRRRVPQGHRDRVDATGLLGTDGDRDTAPGGPLSNWRISAGAASRPQRTTRFRSNVAPFRGRGVSVNLSAPCDSNGDGPGPRGTGNLGPCPKSP